MKFLGCYVVSCKFCREESVAIKLGFERLFVCKECVEYLSYLYNEEIFELSTEVAESIFNGHCCLKLLRKSLPKASLCEDFSVLKKQLSIAIDNLDYSIFSSNQKMDKKLVTHLNDLKNQLSVLLKVYSS
ncbi:hypothetical protein ACX02_21595 [Vibrio parahaemolyticus]|nr:hypothetical protein ACX02_21595 [Vibrio parahaemolyticus]